MTAPEASSRGSWLVRLVVVLCACFVAFFVVLYADDFVHGKRSEAEIAAAAAARNASSASSPRGKGLRTGRVSARAGDVAADTANHRITFVTAYYPPAAVDGIRHDPGLADRHVTTACGATIGSLVQSFSRTLTMY